ncbi:MAG: hypothetical protein MSH11_05015 [Ruminococcus sp.]|nr:hypothetical protein [Ruminococcus sp.]
MKKLLIIIISVILSVSILFCYVNDFFITFEIPYFDEVELGITDKKLYNIKGLPDKEFEYDVCPGKECIYKETLWGEKVETTYEFQEFIIYRLKTIVVEFSEESNLQYDFVVEKVKKDVLEFYDINELNVKYEDDTVAINLKGDRDISISYSENNIYIVFSSF